MRFALSAALWTALATTAAGQDVIHRLAPTDPSDDYYFGTAVARVGDTIVVNGLAYSPHRGVIHFFEPSGAGWSVQRLEAPIPKFCGPISVSDGRVVVGAWTGGGKVAVLERVAGIWKQTGKLRPDSGLTGGYGTTVALDGPWAAVFGTYDEPSVVHLFHFTQGQGWEETQRLVAAPSRSHLGAASLALDGKTLFASAYAKDLGVWLVQVYERKGMSWSLTLEILAPDPESSFGADIDIEDDRAVVAAPSSQGWEDGEAWIVERSKEGWALGQRLASSADQPFDEPGFGRDVRISGERVAVLGYRAANAWLFELREGQWVETLHTQTLSGWDTVSRYGLALDGETLITPALVQTSNGTRELVEIRALRGPVGSAYCTAEANSTGTAARIGAIGSAALADRSLSVHAWSLPPDGPVLLLAALETDFVPFAGGGQGTLCLGGAIGRFPQVLDSQGGGSTSLVVDAFDLPVPGHGAAQPGETWFFQAWYRDANPDPTSNLTDGLALMFE